MAATAELVVPRSIPTTCSIYDVGKNVSSMTLPQMHPYLATLSKVSAAYIFLQSPLSDTDGKSSLQLKHLPLCMSNGTALCSASLSTLTWCPRLF